MSEPAFYPEESLEEHGFTPDDFDSSGCYAIQLAQPGDRYSFCRDWYQHYDVDPPDALLDRIVSAPLFAYVGATGNLLERLHDHLDGEKRRVKLLAICPPVALIGAWAYADFEEAELHEREHAREVKRERGGVAWVNGEVIG